MRNKYEIRDKTVAIFLESKGATTECLVSLESLPVLLNIDCNWKPLKKTNNHIYATSSVYGTPGKRKMLLMHRVVINASQGFHVDHKDHNTLNNQLSNLREVTNSENKQNLKGAQANSKTGVRGVVWSDRAKKYQVQVTVMRKIIHIGSFADIDDAKRAAVEARAKYHGYSYDKENIS